MDISLQDYLRKKGGINDEGVDYGPAPVAESVPAPEPVPVTPEPVSSPSEVQPPATTTTPPPGPPTVTESTQRPSLGLDDLGILKLVEPEMARFDTKLKNAKEKDMDVLKQQLLADPFNRATQYLTGLNIPRKEPISEVAQVANEQKLRDDMYKSLLSKYAMLDPTTLLTKRLAARKAEEELKYDEQLRDPNSQISKQEVAAYNAYAIKFGSLPPVEPGKVSAADLRARSGGTSWAEMAQRGLDADARRAMANAQLELARRAANRSDTAEARAEEKDIRERTERERVFGEAPTGFRKTADTIIWKSVDPKEAEKERVKLAEAGDQYKIFKSSVAKLRQLWGDVRNPSELSEAAQTAINSTNADLLQSLRRMYDLGQLQGGDFKYIESIIPQVKELFDAQGRLIPSALLSIGKLAGINPKQTLSYPAGQTLTNVEQQIDQRFKSSIPPGLAYDPGATSSTTAPAPTAKPGKGAPPKPAADPLGLFK